jgi:hypothetical protein
MSSITYDCSIKFMNIDHILSINNFIVEDKLICQFYYFQIGLFYFIHKIIMIKIK